MVLGWYTFKIVSGDHDLHPRWLPWADIVLTYIVKPYGIWIVKLRCIRHADILRRAYLCQVSDTGSPEPLVLSTTTHWWKYNFFNNFPIGPMLKLCPLTVTILDRDRGHWTQLWQFYVKTMSAESWPPKDHSCHVYFKLTYWFHQRRLLNIFSIGSYVKTKSSHGGHLEFPIGKRFTSLVQDHPMIIPAKSQFNWLGGFWQEEWSLGGPVLNLWIVCRSEIQDGHHDST
jgi:hypothetical protein